MNFRAVRPAALVAVVWALSGTAFCQTLAQAPPTQQGQPGNLLAGAAWKSAEGGRSEAVFTVEDPAAWVGGRLLGPAKAAYALNGKPVAGPLRGMTYSAVPFDAPALLVKGANTVSVAGAKDPAAVRLELYAPAQLDVQTGPILGAIGADFFTVTCRTNSPATVEAKAVGDAGNATAAQSPRGYYHRLRVPLAPGTKQFQYTLAIQAGAGAKKLGPFSVKVPGARETFRFIAAGDNRSNPRGWAAVLDGMLKFQPELIVLTGDLASSGKIDELWDREFFGPGRRLMPVVPTYAVLGNHDQSAPAYFELIYGPNGDGRNKNWSQTLAGVQFVGIDGDSNGAFVEAAIKDSKAKFIFLATHYPAYSSGSHGGSKGSEKILMPILAKYKATAMLAGHDHLYERSEPPADAGVTCLVTGGGGAPLYGKKKRNPYSKAFTSTLHFCAFEVKGDLCVMKALDAAGKVIDEKTFPARALGAK